MLLQHRLAAVPFLFHPSGAVNVQNRGVPSGGRRGSHGNCAPFSSAQVPSTLLKVKTWPWM
jgi:hypothetical protein